MLRRMRVDQLLTPIGEDDDADAGLPMPETALRPLDDLARAETVELVRKAVLSLPAKYREVVVLCELQDVSYEEASRDPWLCDRHSAFAFASRAQVAQRSFGRRRRLSAASASLKSARCFA